MKITFKVLSNCINVAYENLKSSSWTKNNVIVYCGVHGINQISSKKLIERVQNGIVIDYINNEYKQSHDSTNIEAYNEVKNDFMEQKERFTLWKGGPYQNINIQLDQFVDVVMYLIYLRITKATNVLIEEWIGVVLKPNNLIFQRRKYFLIL